MRALILVALITAAACSGGTLGRKPFVPPSPKDGDPIQIWERDADSGGVARILWARNDAKTTVVVTGISLFDCKNTKPACGDHKLHVEIAPGRTVQVLRISAADPRTNAGSFRYKFDLEYAWTDSL